jgi:glycosyltransferase involved in cell wall biosynthesis
MKILQVIDKLDLGGAERVFVDLSNILMTNNEDVTCLFLLERGELGSQLDKKIPSLELKRWNKFNLFLAIKCACFVFKFDIIHCHMCHVYRYVRLISLLTFRKNKIILHAHSGNLTETTPIPFLFSSLLKPQYFIGVAQSQLPWAINKLGMKPGMVFFSPNSINIQKKLAQKIRVRNSDIILIGNIKRGKNQLFAVDIATDAGLSMNIFGNNQEQNYYDKLSQSINMSQADVIIYEGFTDASSQISASRIGLSTSMNESGPLVLIEFLAKGIPFLTFKTGEVANIISKYYPEFIIDNFLLEEWVDRIHFILSKKYEKKDLVKLYKKHFSPENYYIQTKVIYKQICAYS